jgi:hypothetical protein
MSTPTQAQVAYAQALGVYRADMSKDECSGAIDEAKDARKAQIKRLIEDARHVKIESVLGVHGLKGKGGWRYGPCPFCKDAKNEDRFVVNLRKNAWLCRCCTNTVYKGPIDFVMRRDSVSFIQAVVTLTGGNYAIGLEWKTQERVEAWEAPWWLKRSPAPYLVSERFAAWQAHKPLSRATIERHGLGLGIVPACSCKHQRLIVPIYDGGQLVNIRGRRLDCNCHAKWISSARCKNALYGLDEVSAGGVLWIVANNVDRLLFEQACPGWQAVSPTMGEGSWRDEWTARLVTLAPQQVVVAYDNDEAGYRAGIKVAGRLKAAGVNARIWEWQPGTPAKADVAWLLMQKGEAA